MFFSLSSVFETRKNLGAILVFFINGCSKQSETICDFHISAAIEVSELRVMRAGSCTSDKFTI